MIPTTEPGRCRFGDNSRVAVHILLDRGCACFPDDREQWLCAQHWVNCEPIGSSEYATDSPPWPPE